METNFIPSKDLYLIRKNDVFAEKSNYKALVQVSLTACLTACETLFTFLNTLTNRFVKNLSPDKINLSTLKGEGDLTNLELDEKVLTSLLELPNWLTLDRAWCNRVSIRIPWTKLKSVPICLVSHIFL